MKNVCKARTLPIIGYEILSPNFSFKPYVLNVGSIILRSVIFLSPTTLPRNSRELYSWRYLSVDKTRRGKSSSLEDCRNREDLPQHLPGCRHLGEERTMMGVRFPPCKLWGTGLVEIGIGLSFGFHSSVPTAPLRPSSWY